MEWFEDGDERPYRDRSRPLTNGIGQVRGLQRRGRSAGGLVRGIGAAETPGPLVPLNPEDPMRKRRRIDPKKARLASGGDVGNWYLSIPVTDPEAEKKRGPATRKIVDCRATSIESPRSLD